MMPMTARMKRYWPLGLAAACLWGGLVSGCAAPLPLSPASQPDAQEEMELAPVPTVRATPAKTSTSAPEVLREPAVAGPEDGEAGVPLPFSSPAGLAAYDLSQRMGVAPEQVVVLRIREMQLPADGLGCPGGPQVHESGDETGLVRGQQIVLALAGREYVYHAYGWNVTPCEPQAEFSDLTLPLRPGEIGAPVDEARRAVGQRLGVKLEAVQVDSVEAVEWPDASLGCPQPGMMYAQVVTPGYRIVLQAKGERFEYHSGQAQGVLCDKTLSNNDAQ